MEESGLKQCPFEPSHRILPSNFQNHLRRCRKNHLHSSKVICPFNVTHILEKSEMNAHVQTCPERSNFEHFKHRENIVSQNPPQPEVASPVLEAESENWDDEEDAPTYNPQQYAANANILRALQGGTQSERTEFRKNEHKRLLGINH